MKTNSKQRDYGECVWTRTGWLTAVLKSVAVAGACAYFFYRSFLALIPLSGIGVLYYRLCRRKQVEKGRWELVLEFRECILSVAAALRAGYAVENAFLESRNDMRILYGKKSMIYQELELIRRGLVINITLEELLTDLGRRSHSGDIRQFAETFCIARRNGGNLPDIIAGAADLIGGQIDVNQEIRTLLAGREMEQKIMRLMPFGILLYIGSTYPGYFDSLYHNWQGIVIMTVCLAIYLTAYGISERILQEIARELAA